MGQGKQPDKENSEEQQRGAEIYCLKNEEKGRKAAKQDRQTVATKKWICRF